MQNLPKLIRTVRTSQGIPQSRLAEYLGISQASIAKYETMKSTLSMDTLLRAANFLNLNPIYIEKGLENPFKASDPSKIIKMIMPEAISGEVDLELLDFMLQSSEYTTLLMLKPENRKEFRWRDQSFSLLVRDKEGNTFVFRRKNVDSTFSDRQIQFTAKNAAKMSKGFCAIASHEVADSIYERIRKWSDLDVKDLGEVLEERQRMKNYARQSFFGMLLNNMIENSPAGENRSKLDLLKVKIGKLRPDQLEFIRGKILPQYQEILDEEISDIS